MILCSARSPLCSVQSTLQKIESGKVWSPMSTPTLLRPIEQEKLRESLRLGDIKVPIPIVSRTFISHY